jgi:hypothetical protein
MNKTCNIAIFIFIMYWLGILICKEYAIYKQPTPVTYTKEAETFEKEWARLHQQHTV